MFDPLTPSLSSGPTILHLGSRWSVEVPGPRIWGGRGVTPLGVRWRGPDHVCRPEGVGGGGTTPPTERSRRKQGSVTVLV